LVELLIVPLVELMVPLDDPSVVGTEALAFDPLLDCPSLEFVELLLEEAFKPPAVLLALKMEPVELLVELDPFRGYYPLLVSLTDWLLVRLDESLLPLD
jgi:hypothetical protein